MAFLRNLMKVFAVALHGLGLQIFAAVIDGDENIVESSDSGQ